MKILSVATRYEPQRTEDRIISRSRMCAAVCPLHYRKVSIAGAKPAFESIQLGTGKYFESYVEAHFKQKVQTGFSAVWLRHWFGTPEVRVTAISSATWSCVMQQTYTATLEQDVSEYAAAWWCKVNNWQQYPAITSQLYGWNTSCPAYRQLKVLTKVILNPTEYSRKEPVSSESACFVATCAYGDPKAADDSLLRRYCDQYLRPIRHGKQAITLYERIGTRLSARLTHRPTAGKQVRQIIHHGIIPLVRQLMARNGQGRGSNAHLDRNSATGSIADGARRCG